MRRPDFPATVCFTTALRLSLLLCLLAVVSPTLAQSPIDAARQPDAAPATTLPDPEVLQQRIDALAENSALSEAERTQLQETYQRALEHRRAFDQHAEQLRTYRRALTAAPEESTELERETAALEATRPEPPSEEDTRALESELTTMQSQASALRGQLTELDSDLTRLRARPDQARAQLNTTQQALAELERQAPVAEQTPDLSRELVEARQLERELLRAALREQIAMLEQELLSHGVRLELLQDRRALRAAELALLEKRIVQYQTALNQRRQQEAAEAVRQTEQTTRQLEDRHPVVREAAERNAELSQRLATLAAEIDGTARASRDMSRMLDQLDDRARAIQQQIEIAGFSDALSPVLRSERRQLPDPRQYRIGAERRQQAIIEARLQQFQIEQRLRQLSTPDELLRQLAERDEMSGEQLDELRAELRLLLEDRRQLLTRLSDSYASYIVQLSSLEQAQRRLVATAQEYAELLDEKLFWIASAAPVGPDWLVNFRIGLIWLPDPENWRDVGRELEDVLRELPVVILPTLVVCLVLMGYRRAMVRHLDELAGRVGKVQYDSFAVTLEALLLTLLLALPWPLLLMVTGSAMLRLTDPVQFAHAFAAGLAALGAFLLITDLLRQLCRRAGVGPQHFRWSDQTCRVWQRNLRWFQPLGAVCALLVGLTEWSSEEAHRDGLGRLAFVVGSLGFAWFLARLLHPVRGALGGLLGKHSGLAWRLRSVWYSLIVVLPLLLVGLALTGYHYTALQLQSRLFMSGCLLVGAVLVTYLILRWLNVTRRRLAYAQARAKREAILAARASKDAAPGPHESAPEVQEIDEIDLDALGEQSRALLHLAAVIGLGFGLWLIWADLLPALTFLNEVTLWQQLVTTETGTELTAITLGGFFLALLVLALLLFLARNLPGLMEIILLQRLGMEGGARYAVTTITRYLITIAAIFVALDIIGIGWSQAQWLVAALGVGLGFGLQEIFANFVSGLILLLERPIRVGDTITIDNRSGTVSRIRIRATTITDWDNMEIIIPNKTFITGTLVNWTLTDPITRVIIPVRVGFGVPLERVRELLLETAAAHPMVLRDPEPLVFLLHMGESSMTFEIRVFVRDIMDRLYITNDLYMRVITALREEGIEVPFPQRDLHIRTIPIDPDRRETSPD